MRYLALFVFFLLSPSLIFAEGINKLLDQANSGDPKAQYAVGARYAYGLGVKGDLLKASEWYRKSAEQGYDLAQYFLGTMYANGLGVKHDNREALKWFSKSAEQGLADAQYFLGKMYGDGLGVKQENHLAMKWYKEAANQGHLHAKNILARKYSGEWEAEERMILSVDWLYKVGSSFLSDGDKETALICVIAIYKIAPNHKLADKLFYEIKPLWQNELVLND